MKITVKPDEVRAAAQTCIYIERGMTRVSMEIRHVQRKRSESECVKSLRVQKLRAEYAELKLLRERILMGIQLS